MLKYIFYIILFFVKEIKDGIIDYKNIILFQFKIKSKKNSHFLDYLKSNEMYWKKFDTKLNSKPKVLITGFVPHPGYTVTLSIIGKFVSNIENLSTCGFVNSKDRIGPMIIKSFGVKNIFCLSRGSILNRLKFFLRSIKILNKINDIDEFIKFKYEKINIGMTVYDHIIRFTGVGTLNKISFKFYYFLSLALSVNEYCKNLFKKNSIHAVILSERKWIPGSIIFENALLNNCKVYAHDRGTKRLSIRAYSNISERFVHRNKFSEKLVDYVLKNMKETALEESKKILQKKYEGDITQDDLLQAPKFTDQQFEPTNKKIISKKEISQILGWDEQKPIIGIFNHSFIDGLFEDEWRIFRDHLTWLRSTLRFIKDIKSVNWLIKEHPYAYKNNFAPNFGAKTNAEKELNKIAPDCDHIAMYNKKYSGSALINCLSAAVTCQGSIGLEYPCLGIPTILASDTYYSGFGFNNEPRTEAEYFSHLKNIRNLEKYKLSKEQIDKANIYLYIGYKITRLDVPLLPNFTSGNEYDDQKFWYELIDNVKKYNNADDYFYKMIKKQIKEKNRHIMDFNLLKYPDLSF